MINEDKNKTKILSENLFPVVGIGASAGGLEAFKKLINAIPEDSGMAYILVQHLHPKHESSLPEILQRETLIPVHEIRDNVKVQPDNIYIIPSNKMLVANDGILKLSPRPSKDHKNMPIDLFFTSLAEIHQSHSIGIVLSGNGVDGTLGLKNIKDQGGITFAQDLKSAANDAMPQSAIEAEVVDFILHPEQMPQKLQELNRTFNLLPSDDPFTREQKEKDESFKNILAHLRRHSSVDFTHYKQPTIRRRIIRRMAILKMESTKDYLKYLEESNTEADILFQDLLIPVTSFFRDPSVFENLYDTIFPELIKNKSVNHPLRLWIAACSTGQEAYSMAICLHEYLEDKDLTIKIQIFATDISEKSIAKARTGVYSKREMEGISDTRRELFFTKSDTNYQLKKTIRDMCVFATHNFLKDPPFAKIDLISCRNVLIYLEPFLQKKALATFHYALNEKGYLLLGKSESTGSSSELFLQVGKKEKLYTRKSLPGRFMHVASERREDSIKDKDYGIRSKEKRRDDFQRNADDILLSKYTPAGVIVDEQFDIVQFRGSTGLFLEPSPGKASFNVLKMAKEGLSFELRNALHKSKNSGEIFIKEGILINKGETLVTIEVIPLLQTEDLHFLILFRETVPKPEISLQSSIKNAKDEKDLRIEQLEKDLLRTREDMRSITEDQEAANEELQSANEELLSSTEELQSLNEEMETSKEELQSTNEELITVNQELFDRNEQYNLARLYAEAIVTTIHEPLLVISHDFKIKSANNSFFKTFSLTEEETIGKILFELQNNGWDIPGVRNKLTSIQSGEEKFLEWELTHDFPVVGKRTICFNAQPVQKENDEHWILLALEDITERKLRQAENKELLTRFQNLVTQAPVPILILKGANYKVELANDFYLDLVDREDDFVGKAFFESFPELETQGFKKLVDEVMQTGVPYYANEQEIKLPRSGKSNKGYYNFAYHPIKETDDNITGIIVVITEVTSQVLALKKVEESEAQFRQMTELMPNKISNLDPEGKAIYLNKSWLKYSGKSFEELRDFGYCTIMHPDDLEKFQKSFQKAVDNETDLEMEMRFLRHDGEYKWHLNRTSPVKDEIGKIKLWIGTTTDIHDQKNKEQAKDEFIGIASHEMKTPLTTAKAYVQLLQHTLEKTNSEGLLFAQKANESIDRLNDLIGELLDVSKIKSGKLPLTITPFNFNEMMDSAIESVQYVSPNHKIIKSGEIEGLVTGDKERLQQVVINLLSNAVKYSPKANKVYINLAKENQELKVSVKDEGIGIRKESSVKIFERYYREEGRAREFQGLGIGLSISSEIIERHHGKIWVESEPDKGSTFYFTLPI